MADPTAVCYRYDQRHLIWYQQSLTKKKGWRPRDQLTTKGNNHEIPLPLERAAIVVGPAKDGIQKKPSVKSPCKSRTASVNSGKYKFMLTRLLDGNVVKKCTFEIEKINPLLHFNSYKFFVDT